MAKGIVSKVKTLMGGKRRKAVELPKWALELTPRDWQSIWSASDRVADEFAMTGEVEPETIMTSQGYVDVSSNFVTAYGTKINKTLWPART